MAAWIMVALATWLTPEETPPDSENRVWDFFGPEPGRVGELALQVVDRDRETSLRRYDWRRGYVLPPKEKEEEDKRPPCSQVRKEMLGKLMPDGNNAASALTGSGSYFGGLGRSLDIAYTGWGPLTFFRPEEGAAMREADGTIATMIGLYASDENFRGRVNEVGLVFGENNIGRGLGRLGTGVGVSAGLTKIGAPKWVGPSLGMLAARGDANYLIRNNVDPFLAVSAALFGATDAESLTAITNLLSDDAALNKIPGVDCIEGK